MIIFNNLAPSITAEQIENIERMIGILLPSDFKAHYLKHNGGLPIADKYYVTEFDSFITINNFMPIHHKYDNLNDWTIEEAIENLQSKDALPYGFVPFASDLGGNKICINNDGAIHIVYMDLGNPKDNPKSIRKIASSFTEFIDNLEESEDDDDV